MQTAAAAVIDLDSFRARRAATRPAPAPGPARMSSSPAPVAYAPFWIVWVPAWPVR